MIPKAINQWLVIIVLPKFEDLAGIGPKLSQKLVSAGFLTPLDLLFYLPRHYQDRTRVTPIAHAAYGQICQIVGHVSKKNLAFGRRRSLQLVVSDGSASLALRFFHFNQQQLKSFYPGVRIQCFGEIRQGPQGREMVHPEYKILSEDSIIECEDHYTPVYSEIEGFSQNQFRRMIKQVLDLLKPEMLQDLITPEYQQKLRFPSLISALRVIHFPAITENIALLKARQHPAQKRLAFEELLAHRITLRQLRAHRQQYQAYAIAQSTEWLPLFLKQLPFQLTAAQTKVLSEIQHNLAEPIPMMRLLQGDVGSGKTVVAAITVLQVLEQNLQAAVMAPTEVLAEQLYRQLSSWFQALNIQTVLLTGSTRTAQRKEILTGLKAGTIQLAVGTHALFQDDVHFAHLGLLVIDEQHRFGVEQRNLLFEKGIQEGRAPHQLVMTATPIPRTLAMTLYADLDISVIDGLPEGRLPIQTLVMTDRKRPELIERIQAACLTGAQVYWVCTLIDESEVLKAQAAQSTYEQLKQDLPCLNIGLMHGRLSSKEKLDIMQTYQAGGIHVLVATTVIEVGVDVRNASIMVIENPERLGLSQLHQLRGRVGRGLRQSFCVLLIAHDLGFEAKARLKAFQACRDGFEVAEKDLEQRGPGEVFGKKQSGALYFRIADLSLDAPLLPLVQVYADEVLAKTESLRSALTARWIPEEQLILS